MLFYLLFTISFLLLNIESKEFKTFNSNCGYQSCHPVKEGFINVHLVPHSHDDVGWLKTVDQYFYGASTKYQNAGVQYILDTLVDSLSKNPNRRFIYVETAFFWKWWIQQTNNTKAKVTDFVNNGQLEFVSGGWSMNDEATCHYQSIIDQMTYGLRKLNDTFGECGRPKVGWQIDPFGHSREMANIFAELGFDGVFLGRIDFQDKDHRFDTNTTEVVWRGSDSLGKSSDIFTGILYNGYGPPPTFCWDILCGDEPFIDDITSFEYNVDNRVDDFVAYLDNVTQVYTTSNVLIPMGSDFQYQDAEAWFVNLDKLIKYVNQRQANSSKYNLIYSTPSCYIKAVYDEAKERSWELKKDDFFPYISNNHSAWTGYFTSRPALKRFERLGNNFLQICKQVYSLASINSDNEGKLDSLREAMGILQHHDAITGTEKQHVSNDYARQLERGIENCGFIVSSALRKAASKDKSFMEDVTEFPYGICPLVNISQCVYTEADNFAFILYNPLSKNVSKVVRLPVKDSSYLVMDSQENNLNTQIIPVADFVKNIPGRESNSTHELIFIAENIPALGWKIYYVKRTNESQSQVSSIERDSNKQKLKATEFTIDQQTGLLKEINFDGLVLNVSQNFFIYEGFVGNNEEWSNQSSGAYIFRPTGPSVPVSSKADYKIYKGDIVAEVHQTFNNYIHQIIRINAIDDLVEFDWVVGPLPNRGPNGIEVVSKISTTLKSNATFYTDSNGKQMLKRIRNYRPTFDVDLSEPFAGNYYPVVSKIAIRDEEKKIELAILNDRAQGGSSLNDGEIELMVHRNCLHDDSLGVAEILNETAFGAGLVVRGSHYLTVGSLKDGGIIVAEKDIAQRKLLDTWLFFFASPDLESFRSKYFMENSWLAKDLPANVQILTLEPWKESSFLLRMEHLYDQDEDETLSKSVTVELKDLFAPFEIVSVKETTLGANQWIKDNERLQFNTTETAKEIKSSADTKGNHSQELHSDTEIILNPSQISTFIIEVKKYNIES